MKLRLISSSLLALASATLIGCGGGGSDGVVTISPPPSGSTPPIATTGETNTAALTPAALANLSIAGSVQGVAINSPPVITFQLVNSDNNTALTGFDQWSVKRSDVKAGVAVAAGTGTSDPVKFYPNITFAIAKLVPGINGSPSKWVSYMVSAPNFDASGNVTTYSPGRPGSENNGTLEYIGNGQYKYTFKRDIKLVKDQVAASIDTASNLKADLGDLAYDDKAVHRLVIQISGAVRGSTSSATSSATAYCNTSDGVCPTGFSSTPYEFIRTPVDLVYDWIPATGRFVKPTDTDVAQREIVNVAACASCHNKFTFHGGNALKGWGGGRQESRQCMVCHTDQRKFGRAISSPDASGNFSGTTYALKGISTDGSQSLLDMPVMIHKIHMGEELTRTGYNIAGVQPNHVKYPQLITNCAKCHSGEANKPDGTANTVTKLDGTVVQMATPQGNNWYNKPTSQACGACHDGINFNTGLGKTLAGATTGHGAGGVGGPQADDSKCATCHTPGAIKKAHVAITPLSRTNVLFADCASFGACSGNNNAAWLAANPNNLPEGAIKPTYDVKSISRNSSRQPVMVFRILQNGARKDFNAAPAGKTNAELSDLEMWDGFMGSPSAYFVFAVPQDGINAPADFNASVSGYLRSIWNGKASGAGAGTLTGPDAEGYYTVTLTGVTVPDNAVMLTGGLGYTYSTPSTMPLTQTNLLAYPWTDATANGLNGSADIAAATVAFQPNKTGGLIVVAPDVQVVASAGATTAGTGPAYAGRREIVEDKRCNNCHQELGAFNESQFHGGQRNDGSTCSWCHTPNRASQGWSVDSTNFVHAIHGALKREEQYTYYAPSTTDGFWKIGYPGVLKNCEACHVPGSYDFSNAASKSAAGLSGGTDRRLFRYAATGNLNSSDPLVQFRYSPYITPGTNYGSAFSFNAVTQVTTNAASTTLLETPTATVCFACHDSTTAKKIGDQTETPRAHMERNGAQIYVTRGAGNPGQTETCLGCHGPTAVNIKVSHSK